MALALPSLAAPVAALVTLRDGSRVRVRRIGPGDQQRLCDVSLSLSPEARYQRFRAGIARLSDSQLRDFTELDHADREAWIALDADAPGEPAVGVGRYVRLDVAPEVAEVAITVVDSHQGRGLGTLLLSLVCRSAAAHGIEIFRAHTFESNMAMVRLLRDLGAGVRRVDGGVLCLDVPVNADVRRYPDTPTGRAFRAIAAGTPGFT